MILGAQPANTLKTFQKIHEISDEVWHQAGDKSIDVSNFSFILYINVKRIDPSFPFFLSFSLIGTQNGLWLRNCT